LLFLNLFAGIVLNTDVIEHQPIGLCLNCEAAVAASFCQHCGQSTANHVPSASEFIHEFVGHYVALEGKLWKTLSMLLFRPGRLTRDYIEGKRARYVEPLRVYLTLSVLFFALFKLVGADNHINFGNEAKVAAVSSAMPAKDGQAAPRADQADKKEAKDEKDEAGSDGRFVSMDDADLNRIASWSPKLAKRVEHFQHLDGEQQKHALSAGFMAFIPYAIFAMMPVFALWLKLIYLGTGRRYGEHLLFALHTNAFAFLMLGLLLVLPKIPYLKPVLFIWLAFYLPTAMRKVYGGSRLATGARWVVLGFLHMLTMVAAMLLAAVLAVIV
jgi:hypothetical protein